MDFLPIEYVNWIIVTFDDGDVWEIDISKKANNGEDVEETLEAFFEEYEGRISNVDFRLDLQKIKRDIGKRTRRFLKLNK